jgi:hypothetical protein
MTKPICGKVAHVLNEREIAVNVGTAHGVNVGMYFDVIDAHDEAIRDPDTDEVLGSIERPKVRVRVTHVQEKLSVAGTYKVESVNIGGDDGLFGPFSRSLMPSEWIKKYETLRAKDKAWSPLYEEDSYVKVGDPVVQVIEKYEREQEDTNGE